MEFVKKDVYDSSGDPTYQNPVLDSDEVRTRTLINGREVSVRYVHGSFEGTKVKFLFCFPEKDLFEGRLFQHLSPFPGPDEEKAALPKTGEDDIIGFAVTHGAAYVECNMGSGAIFEGVPDPSIFYKSNAATAHFGKEFAKKEYGFDRVYAYCFGGSGGGYKTMSCIENTNAFDGAVPFVIGSPMSLPNCLTVPAHGKRILRNSWQNIVDALDAGGSGDPYEGLNEDEAEALREITRMGMPPKICLAFGSDDDGALPVLAPTVHQLDSSYFTDFWTVPGYLGAEEGGTAQRDRVCRTTKVVSVGITSTEGELMEIDDRNGTDSAWTKMLQDGSNAWIEVEDVPKGEDLYLKGVQIYIESGEAAGKKLALGSLDGSKLIPGMSFGADDIGTVIGLLKAGDQVRIDNSDYIAIQTYHRHQVPEDLSFHAWDQFRNEDGTPALPQRDQVIAYGFTAGGCGSVQDGHIQGHVIVMNSLMDGDFPWQADWYRRKVEEVYGGEDKAHEIFRVWYNDNTPHGDVSEMEGEWQYRVVSYLGMLNQALLDVSAWTEKGILPGENTGYELVDNQVILTDNVKKRGGTQPMVTALANGEKKAVVNCGEPVTLTAELELSPSAGQYESAEWVFEEDTPVLQEAEPISVRKEDGCAFVTLSITHTFEKPGTYFPVVRVISNRHENDPFTRLRNMDRVRVVAE